MGRMNIISYINEYYKIDIISYEYHIILNNNMFLKVYEHGIWDAYE